MLRLPGVCHPPQSSSYNRPFLSFVVKIKKRSRSEINRQSIYNLALTPVLALALLRIGSIFMAFMALPRILSLPPMKRRWALAVPATRPAKSFSDRARVTAGLLVLEDCPMPVCMCKISAHHRPCRLLEQRPCRRHRPS